MLARPTVSVDLKKVRENARCVVDHLPGIDVVGVTKGTCGSPQVARALLGGGAKALGESRLENAERLRAAGLTAPMWLLRAPVPELAGEAVQLTDVSLESELETVVALDNAAAAAGRRHAIVAMVDLGDLRDSGSIGMVTSGLMPAAVDTLRIGETILLGVDTLRREPTLGLHLDAITVSAPVIECLVKPSLPQGTSGQDAFGNFPTFTDRGARRRAICALGRQDAPPEGLRPVDSRIQVLGGSSDHLILDVEDLGQPPVVGESLSFVPNYAATLQLFTSPYVHKVFTPPA